MKLPYYTRKDRWIIGILLPPTVVVINFWIFGRSYFSDQATFLLASAITAIAGLGSWHLQIVIAVTLQRKYPRYGQTIKRMVISLALYILVTTATIAGLFLGYDAVKLFNYDLNPTHLAWSIVMGVFLDILAASFHEGFAFYEKWKKVTNEAEELKRENLQTQLESLKAQVNPHFLFNSLNSLSSLISEDPSKAEKFLDEMCKVYRYLLRNNEDDMTTLKAEMQFLASYFHLLKTRYGDSLSIHTEICEEFMEYQLPSLTLQMLVENAVKHNAMMKDLPLFIKIKTEKGKLIVTNNLQRKVRKVSSNKIGLSNIVKKYKLLKQEAIVVNDDGKDFAVVVPLIKTTDIIFAS
ncbi:MAG: histidine kinase [Gemmatimonadaceae bacterium]|nr:histidine kinase [Chitinophagaceae bacterium]